MPQCAFSRPIIVVLIRPSRTDLVEQKPRSWCPSKHARGSRQDSRPLLERLHWILILEAETLQRSNRRETAAERASCSTEITQVEGA